MGQLTTHPLSIAAVDIGGDSVAAVDARELHGFLDVAKKFTDWFKAQIDRARLVEGRDYVEILLPQKGEQDSEPQHGGHNRRDYALTLDAAKHIAMMSGTEKGFEVRDYFIECERQAKAPRVDPANLSRLDLIQLALDAERERLQLAHVVAEQAPKVAALERIAMADGSFCMRDAAKTLQIRPTDLRNLLITERWIYGRPGHGGWLAYQDRIQSGLLIHKTSLVQRQDGTDKVVEQVRITGKGLARLGALLQRGRVAA
jgi:anti-repressor protein